MQLYKINYNHLQNEKVKDKKICRPDGLVV
jgi:hypothetical protein